MTRRTYTVVKPWKPRYNRKATAVAYGVFGGSRGTAGMKGLFTPARRRMRRPGASAMSWFTTNTGRKGHGKITDLFRKR